MVVRRHRRRISHSGHGAAGFFTAPFDRASFKGYWSMDEAAGNNRVDAVGSNDLAEASGNITAAAAKENNGAQSVNLAADYLSVANHADFTPTTGIVLSFWLVVGGTLPSTTVYLIQRDPGADPSYYVELTNAGALSFSFIQTDMANKNAACNGALSVSTTYHVCCVAANGKVSIYLDGVEQTDTESYDNTCRNGGNLDVLFHGGALTNHVTIDELGIWKDPALSTEAERDDMPSKLYNSGTGIFYP